MFSAKDISDMEERGSDHRIVSEQIENFKKGFPFLKLIGAATVGKGIIRLNDTDIAQNMAYFEEQVAQGTSLLKFVPASGAASRMFKALYEARENLEKGIPEEEIRANQEMKPLFSGLKNFAFYNELKELAGRAPEELPVGELLGLILTESGLDYGNLPKGLLKFHHAGDHTRSSFEEHCVEGALYAQNADGKVKIHFTVSPEHQQAFERHLSGIKARHEKEFRVTYEIMFSRQKPATDTIAVTPDNEPFRNDDGSLLFRPGGHGALLSNLNELDADLVFIKNIDNVVPDYLKPETVKYKKALAGLLLRLQHKIFSYQQILDTHHYYALDSAFFAEAVNFLENILYIQPPADQYYTEKENLYHYLRSKFDRPIRVCGMVKNEGEPGGGPFLAENADGSVSLQVVESSQIDPDNIEQKAITDDATHFNPVDLVCAFKNYKGEKYDLNKYTDPATGFISKKSKDGKALKAQELPGLWNGAMADWNTLFVEVPIITFNPVKTINDLLRKEHQPE
ncbi:DUF4301 family protein [Gaoshiqia sp. Z1-71]|uniref:DUF4301 family protein n=1 Tax=Gaoshiqia hydrogeniformans TaxID=3290090 RepID=UPI003BF8EAF9